MKNEKPFESTCKFNDSEIKSNLTQKKKLGDFINTLIYHFTQKENSIQYVFVNDYILHEMNLKFLNHDTYTDIITFDLSEKKSACINADIYISIDRVKENALHLNVPYQHELLRVICHGALHLCGYKDNTKVQKDQMRNLESTWIEKYLTHIPY